MTFHHTPIASHAGQRPPRDWAWRLTRSLAPIIIAMTLLFIAVGSLLATAAGSVQQLSVNGAVIEMPRIIQRGSAGEAVMIFDGPAADHEIVLGQALMDNIEITRVSPSTVSAADDAGMKLLFPASTESPYILAINLIATGWGRVHFPLWVDGVQHDITLFIIP
ncbi:hypothetical protein [Ketogulonicigenium vulgare]|uniref:Uncharacterized protein n=1 Tax=Ketogulonicigenium vulgare (strain WSH-001) TaxID=759362 RepID=F9Y4T1_KETVW|nr:hypothetical protein [Ketogulonicigenium vulgare]ADO43538.1 hypothetical protein EIO_2452 [Ketogulonicigenium vulgare Y25]AEM41815.1 hypothetical protein KVU_1976 [Ketogulonicigenium vulgare WSH-001]ALJ81922.1 hypothetical protein KVH_12555 [Ketogulonicigenium vulgare]ANW34569.1 hypothetical protein KvSKV_12475 [Ketogulonicigenium vulgare]AOZ55573.1 hypothetical protein KVC_2571 [Ketogulonicigenium vulgare]